MEDRQNMLEFTRVLSSKDTSPYSTVTWETVPIRIVAEDGHIVYECPAAEFPSTWSESARNITASKYFREARNSHEREASVKTMIERIVTAITKSGIEQKYFNEENATVFADELRMILLTQRASFNSPVWFNLGVPGTTNKPVISACFINSVDDTMFEILDLVRTEGLIYSSGGGSGVNFSKLRASHEPIKGGGHASGPVSFMHIYNAAAGIILSGGRTRRAAKMCILNIDHPDVETFIASKADQEDLVQLLVEAGMSPKFDDPKGAYAAAKFQNENHSVRLTDDFMRQVQECLHNYREDFDWKLYNRVDKAVAKTVSGISLFRHIAEAAHKCGDPGVQFHDIINRGNTCANDGEILSANPCQEFSWHDNSACNLASLNLDRFLLPDRNFDIKLFRHAVRTLIIAQDILIELAGYPTEIIEKNTHNYRPLGLGFTNLGGMLLSLGVAYSSNAGRDLAAAIACLMTGQAYLTSTELAGAKKPFIRFEDNKGPMEDVLGRHVTAARALKKDISGIHAKALTVWREVMNTGFGKKQSEDGVGFRNCQVTVIPPAGTISFMMDASTTGIEPEFGLKKHKQLVGGNVMTSVNQNVERALISLGYEESLRAELLTYCAEHGHFEGSKLKEEHLPVFDCSIPVKNRYLSVDAHLEMVAAVSPHITGAISKTFNLPHDATVRDIELTFLKAWERGIKGVAVYRAGSKLSEPLRVKELTLAKKKETKAFRDELPNDRTATVHKFSVAGYTGYLTVGFYADGRVGELWLRLAKPGSMVSGLLDSFAKACSFLLQYGMPLQDLIKTFEGVKFSPAGITSNPDVMFASSILDYVFRYLKIKYLSSEEQKEVDTRRDRKIIAAAAQPSPEDSDMDFDLSVDPCPNCGSPMVKTGTCSVCRICSFSSGVCS